MMFGGLFAFSTNNFFPLHARRQFLNLNEEKPILVH